ncbi:MAG: hypothetical protein A2664_03660 [Candidatus Taylorbacteria bacterium RIFCSPHIGHO2_01_FULL_46_22b]|uniref:PEP-utilising enzyme mobile domain-containing protein n=1 Tax=Candidatus Taylorbacteria bacterium RIFCSPHIGHO2_01_FULL_46_22b TaxID=1802301 RepID=A0A1G2M1E5_9BACT|nr:MAG: hypothetical protein A2664_03660 [Candidatus Taylorbacteria bacterium RIFCSPHIGHO2_01_FULL_46_22b]
MFETRAVRPYYTAAHIGFFAKTFFDFAGFEYKNVIYLVSPDMSNRAYFDVEEMNQAGEYFRKVWEDPERIKSLLTDVRKTLFTEAKEMEEWAWKQVWKEKETLALLVDVQTLFNQMLKTLARMFISNPQHVKSLEEKITTLLDKYQEKDKLLRASTYWPEDLPWAQEEKEIEEAYKRWSILSVDAQNILLQKFVTQYGWFNEIEGEKPFDADHYREKILSFVKEGVKTPDIPVPPEILNLGRLIGELGCLRFWTRYHFMHLRYHLKKILEELVFRSKQPDLEFATVEEMIAFFSGQKIDMEEIRRRKSGYVSILNNRWAVLLTGEEADKYKKLVAEDFSAVSTFKGSVANKGKVIGRVRVVSFVTSDYNEQVSAFQKGEILVTGMTRPQIVHLCAKAAAIVTDEGGITSHAAVVARELNVPAVIGTQIATKILQTGDLVEVDAEKGVVTILKRAEEK